MVVGSSAAGTAIGYQGAKRAKKRFSGSGHVKRAQRHDLASMGVGALGGALAYHQFSKGKMSNTVYVGAATAGVANAFGGAALYHRNKAERMANGRRRKR